MLSTEIRDSILFVGLNRPEKRNAFNDDLIKAIDRVFSEIPDEVRCAVIYGIGKHFSAGLDLSELQSRDAVQGLHHSRMWHNALNNVQFGKVPVVAVLHGAVVGGGLELAAACHIRVAEQSAFFALPEGQRGIFVGGGGSVRVPKLIGLARMTDMMLTGRVYQSDEAERIGLTQYLVEEGKGLEKATELAVKIAGNAGMTNYALTHILPKIVDSAQEEGLMIESLTAAIAQNAPEAKERLTAFLEGRAKKVNE